MHTNGIHAGAVNTHHFTQKNAAYTVMGTKPK